MGSIRTVLHRRLVPQYKLEGGKRWRRSLGAACWDFAWIRFAAKYSRSEKSEGYRHKVCCRYTDMLERKLRLEFDNGHPLKR